MHLNPTINCGDYRYGFNGMEKDDEIKGAGNSYDFGARMYDSRLGRWLSIDALFKSYPAYSPYVFVANQPIRFIDDDGRKIVDPKNGKEVVYNEKLNKFTYTDGSDVSKSFVKRQVPQLEKFTKSQVGISLLKQMEKISTEIIFDKPSATDKANAPMGSNSIIQTDETKNDEGLYQKIYIKPMWKEIEKNALEGGMDIEEKYLASISVEFGHFSSKAQIDLEGSYSNDEIYEEDSEKFAEVYNGLLNKAIELEIEYRKEKKQQVSESVFNPIIKNKDKYPGLKLSTELQKIYDKLNEGKSEDLKKVEIIESNSGSNVKVKKKKKKKKKKRRRRTVKAKF